MPIPLGSNVVSNVTVAELFSPQTNPAQNYLFDPDETDQLPADSSEKADYVVPAATPMRTFSDDEATNILLYLPQAERLGSVQTFRDYLRARLPYNSAFTRARRANYIINRLFRHERIDTPLAYYAARCATVNDLKPAVFYHVLKAEPLAVRFAEDLIWPALPLGYVQRSAMREFVLRLLPDSSVASVQKMIEALLHTYNDLDVAAADLNTLRFHLHTGTRASFLYVLTAEYPQAGIYSLESLENGPLRTWLLWDREWMRRQLYQLQDIGIVSKVSEIDTLRQFSLALDQPTLLRTFFAQQPNDTVAPTLVGP